MLSACWYPLEIKAVAKSSKGTMARPLEETLPDFSPRNRRHRSRVELGDPTIDLGRPLSLGVLVDLWIQAGEQCFSEGRAVPCRERQGLVQDLSGVAFHQSIVATSPLCWRRRSRPEMGNRVGEPKFGSIVPPGRTQVAFDVVALATMATRVRRGRRAQTEAGGQESGLQIELRGNLAAMLSAAQNATRSPETGDLELQIAMVAGARNLLNLEFSWTAA
jgi:hypothetical protein